MHKNLKYYLMLAFVEGAAVMAVELVSAKLIGPWFGTSLFVWASVLGVTMTGLAAGYYLGGWVSEKQGAQKALGIVLALAGLLIGVMPLSSGVIMKATVMWDVRWGSLVSCLVYLMPPIWLLGMVSPLLIRRGTAEPTAAGKVAGLVYAISTIGGILMTFLLGFYGMSRWGLRAPLITMGSALLLLALLVMILEKRKQVPTLVIVLLAAFVNVFASRSATFQPWNGEVVLQSEGMGGQLAVVDEVHRGKPYRTVYLNRFQQSSVAMQGDKCSEHPYVYQLSRLAAMQPKGSRCLLLGMGGGSLLGELVRMGHSVEGCELEPRMLKVAEEYFDIPVSRTAMRADDARLCINQMQGKYDFVVMDIFYGDHTPAHVLTRESLTTIYEHLHTHGMLVVLFPGPMGSDHVNALTHTLHATGFQVSVLVPDKFMETGKLFVATQEAYNTQFFPALLTTPCLESSGIPPFPPAASVADAGSGVILTDDVPVLEQMLLSPHNWRTVTPAN